MEAEAEKARPIEHVDLGNFYLFYIKQKDF